MKSKRINSYLFTRTALIGLLLIIAVAVGLFFAAHIGRKSATSAFENRVKLLSLYIQQQSNQLDNTKLEDCAMIFGSALIAYTDKGVFESSKGLRSASSGSLEQAVAAKSTEPVTFYAQGEFRSFASFPSPSEHLQHLFVEQPAEVRSLQLPETSILLLLLVAIVAVSFVFALLVYRADIAPQRQLADAAVRASLGDEVSMPHLDRSDAVGDLARAFSNSIFRIKEMQQELLASEKIAVFRQLTAGIAHEVRNPLTAMRMTAQMLKRKFANDPQAQEWLDVIISEIDRLTHHMEQLINFGMPYEPKMQQTVITDVINEVLLLMRRQIEHAGITVIVSFEPNLPMVYADSDQMRQVLLNIIINSVQAMAQAGTLTISAKLARVKGDPLITVAVEDTGPGIPDDVATRIFDPFFSTKSAGTGLGLAIAKKIIEAHSGRIRFTSTGKGTIFRIFLPISPRGRRLTEVPTDLFLKLEADENDKNTRNRR